MKLMIATKNRGKVAEIQSLLGAALRDKVELVSLLDMPAMPSPKEDGNTFEENAKIKGLYYADKFKSLCVVDDSGLSVEALGGMPGVNSARFAGLGATDEQNNKLLLERLSEQLPPRKALFVCVAVAALPGRVVAQATGAVQGEILNAPCGGGGFGYDPLFLVTSQGKTMAELPLDVKNQISHRGVAMRALIAEMKEIGFLPK